MSSPPVFSAVRVTRSLVIYICFVDRCLSFVLPLCCLFFFDIRILITPLVSSISSSYIRHWNRYCKRVLNLVSLTVERCWRFATFMWLSWCRDLLKGHFLWKHANYTFEFITHRAILPHMFQFNLKKKINKIENLSDWDNNNTNV